MYQSESQWQARRRRAARAPAHEPSVLRAHAAGLYHRCDERDRPRRSPEAALDACSTTCCRRICHRRSRARACACRSAPPNSSGSRSRPACIDSVRHRPQVGAGSHRSAAGAASRHLRVDSLGRRVLSPPARRCAVLGSTRGAARRSRAAAVARTLLATRAKSTTAAADSLKRAPRQLAAIEQLRIAGGLASHEAAARGRRRRARSVASSSRKASSARPPRPPTARRRSPGSRSS